MNHLALLIPGIDRLGGAERQLIVVAQGLLRRNWRVSVVALTGAGGPAAASLIASGAGFHTLEMRKGLADPRGWFRFNRWLTLNRPDVLHAHLPHAVWLGRWSRLAAPVRALVDTFHTSATGPLSRRLGYRASSWLPDQVTAVSNAVAETHLAARMASTRQLTILPNGVEPETWRPSPAVRQTLRRSLGLAGEFLWFAAGRLDPVKDYATLLTAMAGVPQPAHLVIAGSGPLQIELLQLSTRLNLQHRVRFLGFEPDVRSWMQAADAFVSTSLWEGLPMGIQEAAACALPTVATDVPGTREVVTHGQTGWLTPPGDAPALAQAMTATMQTSPHHLCAMGNRARQHIIEQFSLESVLDRWEALYHDLLHRNANPRRWSRPLDTLQEEPIPTLNLTT